MTNPKLFILAFTLISLYPISTNAQILKNLRQKVEQKVENIIDKELETANVKNPTKPSESTASKDNNQQKGPFKNLSPMKFDFIQGQINIFQDQFITDSIGNMASKWTTNGVGTIAKIEFDDRKWLEIFNGNTYKIKELVRIPENFTLEFDLATTSDSKHQFNVDFGFDYVKAVGQHYYLANRNPVNIKASYYFNRFEFTSKEVQPNIESEVVANMSYFVNDIMQIKIKVEGTKMCTYINNNKIQESDMIDPATKKYFYITLNSDDTTAKVYLTNFRIDKI